MMLGHNKSIQKRGFSLIEILIVVAIIGLLSSQAYASFQRARQESRNALRESAIAQFRRALFLYADSCGNQYPSTLSVSADNGCQTGTSLGSFLSIIPSDPLGGSYQYAAFGSECSDYHLGTPPDSYEGTLPTNDINRDSSADTPCAGSGAGFDGNAAGVYDIRP